MFCFELYNDRNTEVLLNNSAYHTRMAIPRIWNKIVILGIHDGLPFDSIKRIRVINSIALWIGLMTLITPVRWVVLGHPELIVTNVAGAFFMMLVIFLNSRSKYNAARAVFFLYAPAHVTMLTFIHALGFEFFLFPILVIAGFVIDRRRTLIAYLILIGMVMVLLRSTVVELQYLDFSETYSRIFFMVSVVLSLILCYLSINLFIKQYEENRSEIMIKNEMLEASVQVSRDRAEFSSLLLREMNHRIKNNLQLISSLLNMHAQQVEIAPAKKALEEARNRVQSIALIHKQLYKDDDIHSVKVEDFLEDLIQNIQHTSAEFVDNIQFDYSCDLIELGISDAITIGLIINELLTNSIQHGTSQTDNGSVIFNITQPEDNMIRISSEDNGSGLKKAYDKGQIGFGFELITTLSTGYDGKIFIDEHKNKITVDLYLKK